MIIFSLSEIPECKFNANRPTLQGGCVMIFSLSLSDTPDFLSNSSPPTVSGSGQRQRECDDILSLSEIPECFANRPTLYS